MNDLPPGAFVWTNFPFGDPPEMRSQPGPFAHIGYVFGSQGELTLLAYTSSRAWDGDRVPPGVVQFDPVQAAALRQRPFYLDLRVLAWMRPGIVWFPRWNEKGCGIVAVADAATQRRILAAGRAAAPKRQFIIEVRRLKPG